MTTRSSYYDDAKILQLDPEHDLPLDDIHHNLLDGNSDHDALLGHVTSERRAIASLLNGILRPSYSNPPQHYAALQARVASSTSTGRGNVRSEKIYIASNIINEDLIRGRWSQSLLSLIELLGEQNVFVSIYENNSGNGTSMALQELQDQLPCKSSVVTGDDLPLSSFPKMRLPNGEKRVQRLTYLSEVRNRLLRPLDISYPSNFTSGFQSAADTKFDKILFINDIYFDPLDAVQLLFSTNAESGKAEYQAACAVDFIRGAQFYDTFVTRDTDGNGMGFMVYPWFSASGSGISRSAVLQQTDAVPVRSCWGGMVAFEASLFQAHRSSVGVTKQLKQIKSTILSDSALSFRGSNESFWEAAECCLIFADIDATYSIRDGNDLPAFYMNPYIRVAYSESTWRWLPRIRQFERSFEYIQYLFSLANYPDHNPRRSHEPGELVEENVWVSLGGNTSSTDHFELVHRPAAPGGFCGQRRMFVMKPDLEAANTGGSGKNWEKIPIPAGA